jgi:malonyl-CoA O-methyltransferase
MSEMHVAAKQRVAKQFSRAAMRYDQGAQVQIDIAFDAMQLVPFGLESILDIGCGTGRVTRQLLKHVGSRHDCQVSAVDIAEGMVRFAAKSESAISWFTADAESLPFQNNTFEHVFSTMALQWCTDLPEVFSEIKRVLQPQGSAILAIMSEGSFFELNQSWQAIDSLRRVNTFIQENDFAKHASAADLRVETFSKSYTTWHSNVKNLLGSIKQIGANVVTMRQQQTALNRSTLEQLQKQYVDLFAQNGILPLTYKVTFIKCFKD